MRCSNIQVTFKMQIPIDEPDGNFVTYKKEAVKKAVLESAAGLPITFERLPIGVTDELHFVEENGKCYIEGTGFIFYGGTEERVDIENKIVNSMQLIGVGITDE